MEARLIDGNLVVVRSLDQNSDELDEGREVLNIG